MALPVLFIPHVKWVRDRASSGKAGDHDTLRDNRIQLHRSTSTELSIMIGDVQMSDEGEYTCSIFTMPVRTARATVTVLGVPGKPQISGFENAVQEGGKVTLTCTSTGSKPPASLIWYRGDQELEGRPNVVEAVPDDPTYNVSSELTLEVSREDDNALITCAVDHPSLAPGDKRSEQALRVLYAPNAVIQPESDLPREGEKFYLKCVGNSNPEPASFTWEKKDGELPPLAKADGALLQFEMLNKSDNGVYLCQADNGIGNSQGEYTLLVQDNPDTTSPPTDSPISTSSPPIDSSSPPIDSSSPPTASPTEVLSSSSSEPTSASTPSPSPTPTPSEADVLTTISDSSTTALSNALFPDLPFSPSSSPATPPSSASSAPSSPTLPVSVQLNGVYTFTDDFHVLSPSFHPLLLSSPPLLSSPLILLSSPSQDPTAMMTSSGVDHAVIGGVVAVIVFILLCLLIVLGRYLIRHKGTYLTHEAKGSDDAPDADTAIINAEGGHSGAEDKKEYFI
ncbi:cell adhesion molecule 3 [Pleuronectes platessa]|uniref:cell adhesion molecule 3 n=1 Tax=Pleuronectes platessa TaxID=8262 RepID=UPI00232A1CDC|nr:cell adhesion molecule 3 [Pleuronectes platessa]